jgi:hypothetical protein
MSPGRHGRSGLAGPASDNAGASARGLELRLKQGRSRCRIHARSVPGYLGHRKPRFGKAHSRCDRQGWGRPSATAAGAPWGCQYLVVSEYFVRVKSIGWPSVEQISQPKFTCVRMSLELR